MIQLAGRLQSQLFKGAVTKLAAAALGLPNDFSI